MDILHYTPQLIQDTNILTVSTSGLFFTTTNQDYYYIAHPNVQHRVKAALTSST